MLGSTATIHMPGTDQPLRNASTSVAAASVGRSPPSSRTPGAVYVSVHVLGTLTRIRCVASVSWTVPAGMVLPAIVSGTVVDVDVVATLAVGKGAVGPGIVLAGASAGRVAGEAPSAAAVPVMHTDATVATAMVMLDVRVTAQSSLEPPRPGKCAPAALGSTPWQIDRRP